MPAPAPRPVVKPPVTARAVWPPGRFPGRIKAAFWQALSRSGTTKGLCLTFVNDDGPPHAKPLKTPAPAANRLIAVFEEEAESVVGLAAEADFLRLKGFSGKAGSLIALPGKSGLTAWFGLGARRNYNPMSFRALPPQLPRLLLMPPTLLLLLMMMVLTGEVHVSGVWWQGAGV